MCSGMENSKQKNFYNFIWYLGSSKGLISSHIIIWQCGQLVLKPFNLFVKNLKFPWNWLVCLSFHPSGWAHSLWRFLGPRLWLLFSNLHWKPLGMKVWTQHNINYSTTYFRTGGIGLEWSANHFATSHICNFLETPFNHTWNILDAYYFHFDRGFKFRSESTKQRIS